jgi:hypothetical protein
MASATPVTDHEEIREWVESRGGRPACVKGTAALLRVDFGEPDEKLQPIEWDQWFETFDSSNLAALIQQGGTSRFIKLVSRDSAGTRGGGGARGRSKGSRTPIKGAGRKAGTNGGGAGAGSAGNRSAGGRRTVVAKRAGARSAGKAAGRTGGGSARAAANTSGSASGAGRTRGGNAKTGARKGARKGSAAGGAARKTGARAGAKRGGSSGARSAARRSAGKGSRRKTGGRRGGGR